MELANPMGHDQILSVKYFVNYKMTINVHQNKPEEYLVSQPLMHVGRESVVGHCANRYFHKLQCVMVYRNTNIYRVVFPSTRNYVV